MTNIKQRVRKLETQCVLATQETYETICCKLEARYHKKLYDFMEEPCPEEITLLLQEDTPESIVLEEKSYKEWCARLNIKSQATKDGAFSYTHEERLAALE